MAKIKGTKHKPRQVSSIPEIMEKSILTTDDVCKITGLARATISTLIYKNEIPSWKFGPRLRRFDRDLIMAWVKDRQQLPFRPMKEVIAERKTAS